MRVVVGTPRDGLVLSTGRLHALQGDTNLAADDPVLGDVLSVLEDPDMELLVEVVGGRGPRRVAVATGAGIAAVVMSRQGRDAELAAVTPDSIPAVLARTIGLGPAPYRAGEPVIVPADDVEQLATSLQVSPALASSVLGSALSSSTWSLCRMQVSVVSAEGDVAGSRVDVLGAAGVGWWLLESVESGTRVARTTATDLWRMLCTVTSTKW